MTLIALSAAYGAGGSRVGSALGERLGVPFLDRAIPLAVAHRLEVPEATAAVHDEQVTPSWLERVLQGFAGGEAGVPMAVPEQIHTAADFRQATEEVLVRQAATGEGVILGRAAVVVLRDDPRVLRVRLDGPREARLRLAMALGGIDRASAERGLQRVDRMHEDYVRRFYGVSLRDPSLYHLVLDATALSLEQCVEIIAVAAGDLTTS